MTYLASLTEQTEDKLNGYFIIHTKEELDKIVTDNSVANRVIIRRDFAMEYFTPSGLQAYLTNCKKMNRVLTIELDEKSEVLTRDTFIKKLASARNREDMMYYLTAYPNEFMDTIKYLTSTDRDRQVELLNASGEVSRLQASIDALEAEVSNLNNKLEIESSNKFLAQSKLHTIIKRINYQHGMKLDENLLFRVDRNNYDKVIYIKEVTRVQYTDTLVYYLSEILRVLYSMPTRICVIEPYYSYGRDKLYEGMVPHYKLSEQDVMSGAVLMHGMQPEVMQGILKNPNNVSILIVLDRGAYPVPHIKGENVEYFYTVSDLKDKPSEVPNAHTISYDESTLYVPYIQGFDELDPNEKMSKYSSMSIIKKIVSLVEGR